MKTFQTSLSSPAFPFPVPLLDAIQSSHQRNQTFLQHPFGFVFKTTTVMAVFWIDNTDPDPQENEDPEQDERNSNQRNRVDENNNPVDENNNPMNQVDAEEDEADQNNNVVPDEDDEDRPERQLDPSEDWGLNLLKNIKYSLFREVNVNVLSFDV